MDGHAVGKVKISESVRFDSVSVGGIAHYRRGNISCSPRRHGDDFKQLVADT